MPPKLKKIILHFSHIWNYKIPVLLAYYKLRLLDASKVCFQKGNIRILNYQISYPDIHILRTEFDYIFKKRIYHFSTTNPRPIILDGGGYIGLSLLYFKYIYPDSIIKVFEPDTETSNFLKKNIAQNNIKDVEVIVAGLYDKEGDQQFEKTSGDGNRITQSGPFKIRVTKLSNYVSERVDFIKLNIEGAELTVLQELESSSKLSAREMCIEWHSFRNQPQNLDKILAIMKRNGYRYMINNFPNSRDAVPPFKITPKTQYYLLVYTKKNDFII